MAAQKTGMAKLRLANGMMIDQLAFGTFKLDPTDQLNFHENIKAGIDAGYRLFDSAQCYKNEKKLCDALVDLLKEKKIQRSDIQITTKLDPGHKTKEAMRKGLEESIKIFAPLSYIDIVLIHWPACRGVPKESPQNAGLRREAWRLLKEYYAKGIFKAIGVSNFGVSHLIDLVQFQKQNDPECIIPMINQVEYHPCLLQKELKKYCKENQIVFQGYSPLGAGKLLESKKTELEALAKKNESNSGAELLLVWLAHQTEICGVVKASSKQRIFDNIRVFLQHTPLLEDVAAELESWDSGAHFCWDPTNIP